jgi:tetratricopeptide (TPR) repeat protein
VATSLNNLAASYQAERKYADAESLFTRALAIREKVLGPNHPHVAIVLENMADLYNKTGRQYEAAQLHARAKAIRWRRRR